MKTRAASLLLACVLAACHVIADEFPIPHDSQLSLGDPTPPARALEKMELPDGFHATLFAAEPDVRQPIAMTFDSKGRLWVAENFTYAEHNIRFDTKLRDRIMIYEDTDGDGRFDRSKVFWDKGVRLSSIEVGFGGVWATCPPYLLFIPDGDADDSPDAEPVVLIDGWNDHAIHHCLVNGLRWGPDGWLYGRQGIMATSFVGRPGTPDSDRVPLNGGIWRYHPTRHVFEVVAEGTTNPWGMDWDEHGQAFFINTVIGHLWHLIPGAHYQRMYGEDPDAENLYGVIPQTADHYHWDTREDWEEAVDYGLSDQTDRAGGGHAHAGLLIYQGDNWPTEYRGDIFALNFHGRRINRDHAERQGATYTASHRPDLVSWDDPWFRGIDLITGPDGGVFVADWSDIGECHEADGVQRSTGRIYKIVHGMPKPPQVGDLTELTDVELVELQRHSNVWYARQSRRILQERAAAGKDVAAAVEPLNAFLDGHDDVPLRLRALWCLYAIGAVDEDRLIHLLDDPSEYIRTWAVQLLVDSGAASSHAVRALEQKAGQEQSGLVLTFIGAALQRLPHDQRLGLASAISGHSAFADDPVLPLIVWYGIEPVVATAPDRALDLAASTHFEILRRFIIRRLAQETDRPEILKSITQLLRTTNDSAIRRDLLNGLADFYGSTRAAAAPVGWAEAAAAVAETPDGEIRTLVRNLSAVFGDAVALNELQEIAADPTADAATRSDALRTLVRLETPGLSVLLSNLLNEPLVAAEAIRALAAIDGEGTSQTILDIYSTLGPDAREVALATLASRQAWAEALVTAVQTGRIDRDEVPAHVVAQLRYWDDEPIPQLVEAVWGRKRSLSLEERERMKRLRENLANGGLVNADASHGRLLYEKSCAQCHKLFGGGGAIGPELTGAQRQDLGYLLENILAPSASLAEQYRVTIFALADDRIISGLVVSRSADSVTIQTPTDRLVVPVEEIEGERQAESSLMPDGLLDTLDERQIANLIRYLQAPGQVPLPSGER